MWIFSVLSLGEGMFREFSEYIFGRFKGILRK
jgi:hypothetical protein